MPVNPEEDEEILQDVRSGRGFSLADAIGREGGSFLKGESPIPPLVQARIAVDLFIDRNLQDESGALQKSLKNWISSDEKLLSRYINQPLLALQERLQEILGNLSLLYDLVKQTDILWGQLYGDRPYFQNPGQPPHPDDEYTHESVHHCLSDLLACLKTVLKESD
jgi:hypothetical protein